ncbi:MAG TPA: hypothetical protein VFR11_10460 [Micromonosporaceae bacterium]|jgi:predicted RNA methylase|nr:hypothetical protein [Micromonosporaceae bacterium]
MISNDRGSSPDDHQPRYDRALLLLGRKRNDVLTLPEAHAYGTDSFGDPDYLSLYGMTPAQWYARGIRLLGRTAVECTKDALARAVADDIAALVDLARRRDVTVVDPFAGSCNTIYWILRTLPRSTGLAFELDPHVSALTRDNLAKLDRQVLLSAGNYERLLHECPIPDDHLVVTFVAPPWGDALDAETGLDLRRTSPPIAEVIATLAGRFTRHQMVYAVQVYEKVESTSLTEVREMFDWSELRTYELNATGGNHGVVLATAGWRPGDGPGDGPERAS